MRREECCIEMLEKSVERVYNGTVATHETFSTLRGATDGMPNTMELRNSFLIVTTHETSFTVGGRSEHDPTMFRNQPVRGGSPWRSRCPAAFCMEKQNVLCTG